LSARIAVISVLALLPACFDDALSGATQRLDEARIARIGFAQDAGIDAPSERACASPCGAIDGPACATRCAALCLGTASQPGDAGACVAAERWTLTARVEATTCARRDATNPLELPRLGVPAEFDIAIGPSGEACPVLASDDPRAGSLFSQDCLALSTEGADLELGWGFDDPAGLRRLFWLRGMFATADRTTTARGIIDRRDYGPLLDCATQYAFTGVRLEEP